MSSNNKFEYYFETADGTNQEGFVTANTHQNAIKKIKKENKKLKITYLDVQPLWNYDQWLLTTTLYAKVMHTGKKMATISQQPLMARTTSTGQMLLGLILNPLVELISLMYINCMIAYMQSKQHNDNSLTKLAKLPFNSMHESTLDLFCGDTNSDAVDAQMAEEFASELEQKAAHFEVTVDYYMQEFM